METHGRERRHRYYTVAAFRALAAREGLDDSAISYANVDFSAVGGFTSFPPNYFYDDKEMLTIYVDTFKDKLNAGKDWKSKGKKSLMPDGTTKIGRPKKTQPSNSKKGKAADAGGRAHKRKREDGDQENGGNNSMQADPPTKRKRGRPPKKPRLDIDDENAAEDVGQTSGQIAPVSDQVGKAKRGKVQQTTFGSQLMEICDKDAVSSSEGVLKKRRRSVKSSLIQLGAESEEPYEQSFPIDSNGPAGVDFQSEVHNISGGNDHVQSSQSLSEEPRRSSRKRKPTVWDDETSGRQPAGSKGTENAILATPGLTSIDSQNIPASTIETIQDQYSKPTAEASQHLSGDYTSSSQRVRPEGQCLSSATGE